MLRSVLILALSLFLVSAPAAPSSAAKMAQGLHDAFSDPVKLGPAKAHGAIIWTHGRGASAPTKPDPLPFYLDTLKGAGWDVFRLDRPWFDDTLDRGAGALLEHAHSLSAQGYRRIVLAGQSFGGWQALVAAGGDSGIFAVIATAPAAFGKFPDSTSFYRNSNDLMPVLQRLTRSRVMLFLFDEDPFDPGGRESFAEAILGQDSVDHLIVDRPFGWIGHGAANWRGFARRFGPCIARFLDPARRGAEADCDTDPMTLADLPVRIDALPVVEATPPIGIWYGVYPNGREAVLSVAAINGDAVAAEYGWGPRGRDDTEKGLSQRSGRMLSNRLIFDEPGKAKLDAQLRPDGLMELQWSDHGETLRTRLHRLD